MRTTPRIAIAALSLIAALSPGIQAVAAERTHQAANVPTSTSDNAPEAVAGADEDAGEIPQEDREEVLGPEWEHSSDLAWTATGDATGFHVYIARENQGYDWTRVATLQVEGFDTDRWVGNACLIEGGKRLGVVYGPRSFTNDEVLFQRGAFAAIVDLESGVAETLGSGFTLAHFNPGCGSANKVTFTQFGDETTRLVTVDAETPAEASVTEIPGQFTSAVPTETGVVGAGANALLAVDAASGDLSPLVETNGTAFELTVSSDGAIAYLDRVGDSATAHLVRTANEVATQQDLATGELDSLGLERDARGRIHILGTARDVSADLPQDVEIADSAQLESTISSEGALIVEQALITSVGEVAASGADLSLGISATATESGKEVVFEVTTPIAEGERTTSVADARNTRGRGGFGMSASRAVLANPHSPVSDGAACAVPRNDPSLQAMQPGLKEVEWAVNQAVRGNLGNAQSPVMFPAIPLSGGGRVPAQVLLGILAQESNFWQASRYSVPGVPGNPLVGNYFGVDRSSSSDDAWWQIDYVDADCGYGIAQVTDGMEVGEMPYNKQVAIATDYQANIARGLQILVEKWNQTRNAGLVINDGDPAYLENWFYALWAYNTGFYPEVSTEPDVPWGVGWLNNPINPIYKQNRGPFLDNSPSDAANPQWWPYPEKVMGFAAHSAYFLDSVSQGTLGDTFNYATAFTPSWWTSADGVEGTYYRELVKPPIDLFCDTSNDCDPNGSYLPPGSTRPTPCYHQSLGSYDLRCWYNQPAEWKQDCSTACGYEFMTYSTTSPKPATPVSFPPNCSTSGLPTGALVIDNLPSGTASARPGCNTVPSSGSFQFTFPAGPNNDYAAKVDVHQLGAGFNGQLYFTHVRVPETDAAFDGALNVSGTWTLGQALNGWAQVYVHMPSHAAWTQQAKYAINTGQGSPVVRTVNQRNYADTWVSLGTLQFAGTPSITLTNHSQSYEDFDRAKALSGTDDIAWDAVAFVPLAQKPAEFVVALGDSYSSGEGTSEFDGSTFFRGSDHNGANLYSRNACHRSPHAWAYKIDPPNIAGSSTVGDLLAAQDPRIDFHMLACSGAETVNLLPTGQGEEQYQDRYKQQYGELTQLDRGFLDANTSLVTLTIGGNDVGFGPVLNSCLTNPFEECENQDASPLGYDGTIGQMVDFRLSTLADRVADVLREIHEDAPSANVIMQGYPRMFEDGANCILMSEANAPWINSVADSLSRVLTEAAFNAGSYVKYENPVYRFAGHNVCGEPHAITRLILQTTPGDSEQWFTNPNTGEKHGISAQTLHPNKFGTDLYSYTANNAIASIRTPLSGTVVGGDAPVYYATLRWMEGPTSMNVSAFSECGGELRLGLRSGVAGTQDTESLSWHEPHDMQNFVWNASTPSTPYLPPDSYAMNARLVDACAGGGTQTWAGEMYR